jgi:hypothetical protein
MAENRTLTGERLANNKAEYRHIEGFGAREPAARDWFNVSIPSSPLHETRGGAGVVAGV